MPRLTRHGMPGLATVLVAGALLLGACGSSSTTVTTSAPSGTTSPSQVKISISNFKFAPSTFTAKPGEVIAVTNNDTLPHTFTSAAGTPAADRFDTGQISPGQTVTVKAPGTTGTYKFHCLNHPSIMTGSFTVKA
jgi:plastocyanin